MSTSAQPPPPPGASAGVPAAGWSKLRAKVTSASAGESKTSIADVVAAASNRTPIQSLIDSIRKHSNFRSLCGYSVKSLASVTAPPLVEWQINAAEALANGAIPALAYVLGHHPMDSAMATSTASILCTLLALPAAADAMAADNLTPTVLEAVSSCLTYRSENNMEYRTADDVVSADLERLLFALAKLDAAAFITHGGIDVSLKAAASAPAKNLQAGVLLSQAVEHATRVSTGTQALLGLREAGVNGLLLLLGSPAEDASADATNDHLRRITPAVRVLERLALIEEALPVLQGSSLVAAFSKCLDFVAAKDPDNLLLLMVKLIGRVVGDNVGALVATVRSTESTMAAVVDAAGLLAKLVLVVDNAEKLVRRGHVKDLCDCLTERSDLPAAALAGVLVTLAQLAAHSATHNLAVPRAGSKRGVPVTAEMIDCDLITTLWRLSAVELFKTSAAVAAGAVRVLAAAAGASSESNQFTPTLVASGGLNVTVAAIDSHAADPAVAQHSIRFLALVLASESGPTLGTDFISRIVAIAADCMKTHAKHAATQADTLKTMLAAIAIDASITPSIVQLGCVNAAVALLAVKSITASEHIVADVFRFLTRLCLEGGAVAAVRAANGLSATLSAFSQHSSSEVVRGAFRSLIELLADAESIRASIQAISASTSALQAATDDDEGKAASARCVENLPLLEAVSISPTFARLAHSSSVMEVLQRLATTIPDVKASYVPRMDECLARIARTFKHLTIVCEEADALHEPAIAVRLETTLYGGTVAETASRALSSRPLLVGSTTAWLGAIEGLATGGPGDDRVNMVVRGGAVEAIVTVQRANEANVAVLQAASAAFKVLMQKQKGAMAVATRGGTRQVISMLDASTVETHGQHLHQLLELMETMIGYKQAREVVHKQGALGAALHTAAFLDDTTPTYAIAARIIDALTAAEDVQQCADSLHDVVSNAMAKMRLQDAVSASDPELVEAVRRFGLMTMTGTAQSNRPVVLRGATACVTLLRAAADLVSVKGATSPTADGDAASQSRGITDMTALQAVLRGLRNAVKMEVETPMDAAESPALQLIPTLMKLLNSPYDVASRVVDCMVPVSVIKYASGPLLEYKDGAVLGGLLKAMRQALTNLDEQVLSAGLQILTNLQSSHPEAARHAFQEQGVFSFVSQLLVDGAASVSSDTMGLLLKLVEGMEVPDDVPQEDVVQLVRALGAVVSKFCSERGAANGQIFSAATGVVTKLVKKQDSILSLPDVTNLMEKVVRSANTNAQLLSHAAASQAALELVVTACQKGGEAAQQVLLEAGCEEMVVHCLAGVGDQRDGRLIELGTTAFSVLGKTAEGATQCATQLEDMTRQLASVNTVDAYGRAAKIDANVVADVASSMTQLSSMLVLEGAVTADNSAKFYNAISASLSTATRLPKSNASSAVVAAGVQALGRLASATRSMEAAHLAAVGDAALAGALDTGVHLAQVISVATAAYHVAGEDETVARNYFQCIADTVTDGDAVLLMTESGVLDVIKASCVNPKTGPMAVKALEAISAQLGTRIDALAADERGLKTIATVFLTAVAAGGNPGLEKALTTAQYSQYVLWDLLERSSSDVNAVRALVSLLLKTATKLLPRSLYFLLASLRTAVDRGVVLKAQLPAATEGKEAPPPADEDDPVVAAAAKEYGELRNSVGDLLRLLALGTYDEAKHGVWLQHSGAVLMQDTIKTFPTLRFHAVRCLRKSLCIGDADVVECTAADEPPLPSISARLAHASVAFGHSVLAHTIEYRMFFFCAAMLRSPDADEQLVSESLWLLVGALNAPDLPSPPSLGLDLASLGNVQVAVRRFTADEWIARAGQVVIDALSDVFTEQSGSRLLSQLGRANDAIAGCAGVLRTFVDGNIVFSGSALNSDVAPADAYAAMLRAVESLRVMTSKISVDNMPTFSVTDVAGLVELINRACKQRHEDVAVHALAILQSMSMSGANQPVLIDANICPALVLALTTFGSAAVAEPATHITAAVSVTPRHWEFIHRANLATGIVVAVLQHKTDASIVEHCMLALTNILCDQGACLEQTVQAGGIQALETALRTHFESSSILGWALQAVSNLVFATDEIRLDVGNRLAGLTVRIVEKFIQERRVFRMGLRVAGNLTLCDENVDRLVTVGLLKEIKRGLEAHKADPVTVEMACQVTKNVSFTLDPEENAYHARMLQVGLLEAVIDCMKTHHTKVEVAVACLQLLIVVVEDPDVLRALCESGGLLEAITFVLRSLDYDVDVAEHCVTLYQVAAEAGFAEKLVNLQVAQLLLSLVDTHSDSATTVPAAHCTIQLLSASPVALESILQWGGVRSTVTLLSSHPEHIPVLLITLSLWCKDMKMAEAIASAGLPTLLRLARAAYDSGDFKIVNEVCRILMFVVGVESCIPSLIDLNALTLIVRAAKHKEAGSKLAQYCIRIVATIAQHNDDTYNAAKEAGVVMMLNSIAERFGAITSVMELVTRAFQLFPDAQMVAPAASAVVGQAVQPAAVAAPVITKPGALTTGIMHKQGGRWKSWKRRYFHLDSAGVLRYFTDEGGELKGDIRILARMGVRSMPKDKDFSFCIEGHPSGRVYVFRAYTEDDRTKWMKAINAHIEYQRTLA